MNLRDALKLTVEKYKISNAELSRQSGVHQTTISRFFNQGRELGYEKVDAMVNALPAEAKRYYGALVGDFFERVA